MSALREITDQMTREQLRDALEDAMRRDTAHAGPHENSYAAMLQASPREARRIMRKTIPWYVWTTGVVIVVPLLYVGAVFLYVAF